MFQEVINLLNKNSVLICEEILTNLKIMIDGNRNWMDRTLYM